MMACAEEFVNVFASRGRKDDIRKARVAAEMKGRTGCVLFSGLLQCAAQTSKVDSRES
jgi:hypothetical protein